jgi:hypothetical protein
MTPDLERRLLASVDQPHNPDSAFASALLDRALAEIFGETCSQPQSGSQSQLEAPIMSTATPSLVLPFPGQPRRAHSVTSPARPRFRRKASLLAIAAVICLLLGGAAVVAFWAGNDPEPVQVIPAAVSDVDDIPANSATVETLFATTLSSEQFPLDSLLDWDKSLVSYMEMEPGVSYNSDHPAFFCCVGISVLTIIDGELTFENSGPMLVYRSGGDASSPELVEPDTPVIATTGDTVIQRMSVPGDVTNSSSVMTTFLAGYVYYHAEPPPPGACCWPEGYAESEVTWEQTFSPAVEAEGPVSVSWERISFEPGQDIVIDTATSQTILATIRDGSLRIFALQPDGMINRDFSTPLWGPGGTSLDGLNGAEIALVSDSEEPAVLYLFRFNPPVESV